ncbi:MAG: CsbD family protein [Acidimicrobiales bacterium]
MGIAEKAKAKAQVLKGRAKEGVGRAAGDKSLEDKGTLDRTGGELKQAVEKVKDAGGKVKDAGGKVRDAFRK